MSIRRRNNIDNSSPKSVTLARAVRNSLHNRGATDAFIAEALKGVDANWEKALELSEGPAAREFRKLINTHGNDIKKMLKLGVTLVHENSVPEEPKTWKYNEQRANAARAAGYILPPLQGDNGVKLPQMAQRVRLARTYIDGNGDSQIVVFPIQANLGPYTVNQGLPENQSFVYTNDTDKGKPVHLAKQCTIFTNKPSVNFFSSSYLRYRNFQRADHVLDASTVLYDFKADQNRSVIIDNSWGSSSDNREWHIPLKGGEHGKIPSKHTHLSNIVMKASLIVKQASGATDLVTQIKPNQYFTKSFGDSRSSGCELMSYLLIDSAKIVLKNDNGPQQGVTVAQNYGMWMLIWSEMTEDEGSFDTLKSLIDCTADQAVHVNGEKVGDFYLPIKFGNVCSGGMPIIPISAADEVELQLTFIKKVQAVALFEYYYTDASGAQLLIDQTANSNRDKIKHIELNDTYFHYTSYRLDQCIMKQTYLIHNTLRVAGLGDDSNLEFTPKETGSGSGASNSSNAKKHEDKSLSLVLAQKSAVVSGLYYGLHPKRTSPAFSATEQSAGSLGIENLTRMHTLERLQYEFQGNNGSLGTNDLARLNRGHQSHNHDSWRTTKYNMWIANLRPSQGVHRHGLDQDPCFSTQPTGTALLRNNDIKLFFDTFQIHSDAGYAATNVIPFIYITQWQLYELKATHKSSDNGSSGYCGSGTVKEIDLECYDQ